jgi:hypothetical protein
MDGLSKMEITLPTTRRSPSSSRHILKPWTDLGQDTTPQHRPNSSSPASIIPILRRVSPNPRRTPSQPLHSLIKQTPNQDNNTSKDGRAERQEEEDSHGEEEEVHMPALLSTTRPTPKHRQRQHVRTPPRPLLHPRRPLRPLERDPLSLSKRTPLSHHHSRHDSPHTALASFFTPDRRRHANSEKFEVSTPTRRRHASSEGFEGQSQRLLHLRRG